MMPLRFIHVVGHFSGSFLSVAEQFSSVWMDRFVDPFSSSGTFWVVYSLRYYE